MPVVHQTLTTKPPGGKWYSEVEPVKYAGFRDWVKTYPGIDRVTDRKLTENEHLRITQFNNQEIFDKFMAERDLRKDYIERQQWLNDNGFVVENQTSVIP
jgi:hypothetical protein